MSHGKAFSMAGQPFNTVMLPRNDQIVNGVSLRMTSRTRSGGDGVMTRMLQALSILGLNNGSGHR